MLRQTDTYILSRSGIDNAFEAAGLIRLFTAASPVDVPLDTPAGMAWGEAPPSGCDTCSLVVRLEASEQGERFEVDAKVYREGKLAGRGRISVPITGHGTGAGLLLGSRKIAAGAALYRSMTEAYGLVLPWGSLTGVRPVKLASGLLDDGVPEAVAMRLLMERTGMTADKAELLLDVARQERPFLTPPEHSVSLYIGIPFCVTRCLYCSFTSYPEARYGHLIPAYLCALGRELAFVGDWMARKGRRLSTVYVGGGTPTALPEPALRSLLDHMASTLPISGALEFTVEAGRPDTVDEGKLGAIRDAGATRISINPQTMQERTLRRIGRAHSPEQVESAFRLARGMGFSHINADLIAGLPGETPVDFRETLERMACLAPDSLTVHTMAVKRASRLHASMAEGRAEPPTPDAEVAEMVADAALHARGRGLLPYYLYRQKHILANLENIGYARPGAECRYNIETMSERQTILAAGSGAITKISHEGRDMERTENVRDLSHYIGRLDEMLERKRALLERHFP